MRKRGQDLSRPGRPRRSFGIHYDPDAFGEFSESIAKFIGTARFLVFQTAAIAFWIAWNSHPLNLLVPDSWQFDPYGRGLVLLTLVLSLQAAYAAPLILLAQNRQEDRDREQIETDRRVAERTQADTEFLARELASVRLALGDMVTMEELRDQLNKLAESLERINQRLDSGPPSGAKPRPRARPDEPPSQRAVG
jgi:uncharacterized membrane protein